MAKLIDAAEGTNIQPTQSPHSNSRRSRKTQHQRELLGDLVRQCLRCSFQHPMPSDRLLNFLGHKLSPRTPWWIENNSFAGWERCYGGL